MGFYWVYDINKNRKKVIEGDAIPEGYFRSLKEVTVESFDELKNTRGVISQTKVNFKCVLCNNPGRKGYDRICKDGDLYCENCTKQITCIKIYGSLDNMKKHIAEASKLTCLKKYGVSSATMLQETQEKMKSTCLSRYGVDNIFKSDKFKEDLKSHNLEKYGVEYFTQTDEHLQKRKATYIERYGVDHPQRAKSIRLKTQQTCINTYGVNCPAKNPDIRRKSQRKYEYRGLRFDSSWELYLYIYAMENNIPIEKEPCSFEYEYDNNTYKYFPDYRYDGKLIELKGDHFFNEDGTMCNPYDHSQDGKYEAKHQCGLKNGVQFWKDSDIKFAIDYVDGKYTSDFIPLFRVDLPFPYLNQDLLDTSDMGLIHHFHKSIYEATRKGKLSPLQAWMDKDIIEKVAVNRLKYVGRCRPSDILQGFNVTRIANKVSLFKPSLAERLIDSYLSDYQHIVDPFSGFSGRMLGAISRGKAYTGFDINESHVIESNEILKFKNADNVSVSIKDLLKTETTIMENTALFTCPPYGGKEHWNENNDEVEHTCDEWITMCLDKYKVDRYLFVVDHTDTYKDHIVQELTNKSHFGSSKEYVILI